MAVSVSIALVASSARVTSVKFQKHLVRISGPKDRTPGLPGSDKNDMPKNDMPKNDMPKNDMPNDMPKNDMVYGV